MDNNYIIQQLKQLKERMENYLEDVNHILEVLNANNLEKD